MEDENSAAEKAKKVIQAALNSSKCQDNITVVVVCL
jgi:serine/threonine protein phosphatase PrpC